MQRARQEWSAGSRRTTTGLRATAALARTSRAASHHLKDLGPGKASGHERTRARKGAVRLYSDRATSSGGPDATTCPPSPPAPGPSSKTQSLSAAIRMSCSTTMTVLPGLDQPTKLEHEPLDVGGMQPCAWLVEHVERVASLDALEFGRKLDPLRLPSDSSVAG